MAVQRRVRLKGIPEYVIVHGHTILSRDHSARDLNRPSWFDCSMRRVGESEIRWEIYLSYR